MARVIDQPVAAGAARPVAGRRENLLTVLFAAWLIVGIFVDGWAHNNDKPESFFTPWHALFYSGFFATSAWMIAMVARRRAPGASLAAAVPVGYGFGLLGAGVFAFGGVFDMAWHELFGIEVDLEALLSPSHLILFAGALLVTTSPLRAMWADPGSRRPTFSQFLPALLSATLATAAVGFFFMMFSPWLTGAMAAGPYRFIAQELGTDSPVGSWLYEEVQLEGYAAILVTTVFLTAPALLLARRWELPFGTLTFLFGTVSTLVAAIESFDLDFTFASGAVGGLVGDLLYRRLRPLKDSPWRLRAVGAAMPAAMWLAYFALLAVSFDVGWPVEFWAGATVMSAFTGFGLALLVAPPPIPEVG